MAQNDNDHPYPFMQPQNPTVEGTSVNHGGESSASGMEALNLSNSYGFYDGMGIIGAPQNPTVEVPLLPSRNLQHSAGLDWLNHAESSAFGVQGMEEAFNLSNPNYGFYDYEAALHGMGFIGPANAATAQEVQNPTPVGSSVPSPSRNLQDSAFGWFNHGERSASGVQSLVPHVEALNLSNPYGFHDYDTNNHMHEARCGGWVSLAKDSRGSRSLQKKIDEATPQEICKILKELKYHLHELMKYPFGHFVVEKFFQSSNISLAQKNAILYLIIVDLQKLKDVCMDDQGNRVIQQILANVQNPYMIRHITVSMWCITVPLMKNFNGGHVIQQFLKLFPPVNQNVILDAVAKNCVDIAKDKSGCCNIQACMEYDEVPAFLQLVNKLISNAVVLAEDPYGNYVMQFLVKRKKMEVNAMLISRLRYRFVRLSTNKYASNVVEDLLQFSETDHAAFIALELMKSPEFFNVVQHPFGNYVVQRALQYTKGPLHARLYNIILSNNQKLNSSLHGKMVLQYARACRDRASQNIV